jgi:hypothetical protein
MNRATRNTTGSGHTGRRYAAPDTRRATTACGSRCCHSATCTCTYTCAKRATRGYGECRRHHDRRNLHDFPSPCSWLRDKNCRPYDVPNWTDQIEFSDRATVSVKNLNRENLVSGVGARGGHRKRTGPSPSQSTSGQPPALPVACTGPRPQRCADGDRGAAPRARHRQSEADGGGRGLRA